MDSDKALEFIDNILVQKGKRRLNDIQRAVFRGSWEDRAYKEIRRHYRLGCSDDYLMKDVGPELWQLLREVLGQRVTKKNLKGPVELLWTQLEREIDVEKNGSHPPSINSNGSLPVDEVATTPKPSVIGENTSASSPPVVVTDRFTRPYTQQDWGSVPDIPSFRGRERELNELSQWLTLDCRLLAIVGIAGTGKTYLGVRLAQRMRGQFEYLIWRSLSHAPRLDELLADLIPFISDQQEPIYTLPRLMHYIRSQSCLIVLDGFDAVLQGGVHDGSYKPGYEEYAEFLRQLGNTFHQSRVVLTSQEKPRQIASVEGENQPVRSRTLNGLGEQAGLTIFASRGEAVFTGSESDWNALFRRCVGHPLALNVVAARIWDVFGGNVSEFLEHMRNAPIVSGELQEALARQLERLSSLEKTIVHCLASHNQPADVEDILRLIPEPFSHPQLIDGLQSLRRRSLITVEATRYSLHPLMLEFVQQP